MTTGTVTLNESPKKFIFNKVKYQFLAAICGEYISMNLVAYSGANIIAID